MTMKLTGGPLGGEEVTDAAEGTVLELDVQATRGRLGKYEVRVDEETGEKFAVYTGLTAPVGA